MQKSRIIGGENGWNDLAQAEGVTTGIGRFGYECIELETNAHKAAGSTDLLLSFEDGAIIDSAGHYSVVSNKLVATTDSIKGKGAALSRGDGNGITLKGNGGAIFGRTGLVGSFSIEFWLSPAIAESGEKILSWRSSRSANRYSQYQTITAEIVHNHLEWRFFNIFSGYADEEVTIAGVSNIIPRTWSRHTLSFDQENGALEYCVDGKTEAILFLTDTGHENGTVCDPILGVVAELDLCPDYTGKIDNVTIERRPFVRETTDFYLTGNEHYRIRGGSFRTHPILIAQGATLDSVHALMSVPEQTDIRLFVRSGDNCYDWNDTTPAWKEIVSGESLAGVAGQYVQIAAELLPDGGGMTTPSITQLELRYTENPLPAAPYIVRAEPGDGSVTVSWSYSVDDTAGGYYVYYGNRSGEYLGRVALEGASPVQAGNVTALTLTGLQNGSIYYFAVSAYGRDENHLNGPLSQEVYARPSARR